MTVRYERDRSVAHAKRSSRALFMHEQKGVCAICGVNDGKTLHLDHCHLFNYDRGLLCKSCNLALGLFNDDPARLRAALKYLKRTKITHCDVPAEEKIRRIAILVAKGVGDPVRKIF